MTAALLASVIWSLAGIDVLPSSTMGGVAPRRARDR